MAVQDKPILAPLPYRGAITALLAGATFWYLGEGMLGPLLGVFTQKIGGSVLDIAWAWSAYLMVTGLCMFGVGWLCERRPIAEELLVGGYALNTICTFGYLLVNTPAQLFFVQALLGVANAMATPTWNALFSRQAAHTRTSLLWGLADGQEYILTGLAILFGGLLVYTASFATLFITMGSIQLIATIFQTRILFLRASARRRAADR